MCIGDFIRYKINVIIGGRWSLDQIFLRDACFDVLFENEFIKMIMDKRKFVSVVERDVIL